MAKTTTVATVKAFESWLTGARKNDSCIYHVGNLMRDRVRQADNRLDPTTVRGKIDDLADAVGGAAALGMVHPVQSKISAGVFGYIAVKTSRARVHAARALKRDYFPEERRRLMTRYPWLKTLGVDMPVPQQEAA